MLRRTDHRGEDLLARGAVRFPPQTFSRDGGPQPLLGAPIGRVDRGGVKEEREERGPFDSEMDGESPHVGDRARMIELYKDGILDQGCGTVRYGSRPANQIQLLYVGHMDAKRGLDNLVRSLPLLKTIDPKVLVVIAGSGPMDPQLRTLARELKVETNLLLAGWVGQRDVPSLIAAC
jgi:glycosyltransferase involved in cell wall biosynthesis